MTAVDVLKQANRRSHCDHYGCGIRLIFSLHFLSAGSDQFAAFHLNLVPAFVV